MDTDYTVTQTVCMWLDRQSEKRGQIYRVTGAGGQIKTKSGRNRQRDRVARAATRPGARTVSLKVTPLASPLSPGVYVRSPPGQDVLAVLRQLPGSDSWIRQSIKRKRRSYSHTHKKGEGGSRLITMAAAALSQTQKRCSALIKRSPR